jgi:hypothetical protein
MHKDHAKEVKMSSRQKRFAYLESVESVGKEITGG